MRLGERSELGSGLALGLAAFANPFVGKQLESQRGRWQRVRASTDGLLAGRLDCLTESVNCATRDLWEARELAWMSAGGGVNPNRHGPAPLLGSGSPRKPRYFRGRAPCFELPRILLFLGTRAGLIDFAGDGDAGEA